MIAAVLLAAAQTQVLSKPLMDLVNVVREVPDRVVQSLAIDYYRDIRRLVVADDGAGIYRTTHSSYVSGDGFRGMGSIAVKEHPYPEWVMKHYDEEWFLVEGSDLQIWPALDPLRGKRKLVVEKVVAARPEGRMVLLYSDQDGSHLVELSMQSQHGKPLRLSSPRRTGGENYVIPDVSGEGYLTSMPGLRTELGRKLTAPSPGFSLISFSSKHGIVLGYTYGEQGGPIDLATRPLGDDKLTYLHDKPRSGGGWTCAMLLQNGHVLASRGKGLEIWEGKAWRNLGPYHLEGSSSNGRWALISHKDQRKSWVIAFK